MVVKFKTISKKGKGRGTFLGFPTINLVIPSGLPSAIQEGIYAAKVSLKENDYKAALYYGTTPTFDDKEHSLEVYLLDEKAIVVPEGTEVSFEIVKFVRGVEKFDTPEQLVRKMNEDVLKVREILK